MVCGSRTVTRSGVELCWRRDNSALVSLSLPKVTSAGSLRVNENPSLTELNLPLLTTVTGEGFLITTNPMYPACRANALLEQLTSYDGTAAIQENDETATCP